MESANQILTNDVRYLSYVITAVNFFFSFEQFRNKYFILKFVILKLADDMPRT